MEYIYIIIVGVASFIVGALISFIIKLKFAGNKARKIIREAENEAQVIKKEKILQAKEKFLYLKTEHEKHISERNSKIVISENKFKQKENTFNQKREEFYKKQKELRSGTHNSNKIFRKGRSEKLKYKQ